MEMHMLYRKKILTTLMLSLFLTACASGSGMTWYEERCARMGMKKGTSDFELCVARDKTWIEETQKRAARQNHP